VRENGMVDEEVAGIITPLERNPGWVLDEEAG